jgi:hypothetical protein
VKKVVEINRKAVNELLKGIQSELTGMDVNVHVNEKTKEVHVSNCPHSIKEKIIIALKGQFKVNFN